MLRMAAWPQPARSSQEAAQESQESLALYKAAFKRALHSCRLNLKPSSKKSKKPQEVAVVPQSVVAKKKTSDPPPPTTATPSAADEDCPTADQLLKAIKK